MRVSANRLSWLMANAGTMLCREAVGALMNKTAVGRAAIGCNRISAGAGLKGLAKRNPGSI